MKFLKIITKGLQLVILLLIVTWLGRFEKVSGPYILNHFRVQLLGKTTSGIIKKIRENPEIAILENYLAKVTFLDSKNNSITEEFRYGEEKLSDSPIVSVTYLANNPQSAIINEDGGYFVGSIMGICGVLGPLFLLFVIFFLLDRYLPKRQKV